MTTQKNPLYGAKRDEFYPPLPASLDPDHKDTPCVDEWNDTREVLNEKDPDSPFRPGAGWGQVLVDMVGNMGAAPAVLLLAAVIEEEAKLDLDPEHNSLQPDPDGAWKTYLVEKLRDVVKNMPRVGQV